MEKCSDIQKKPKKEKLWTQILATFSYSCMMTMNFGALLAFPSVFIAQSKEQDNSLKNISAEQDNSLLTTSEQDIEQDNSLRISSEQETLMVSIFFLFKIPGFLIGAFLMPRVGRLRQTSLGLPILAVGWLCVAFCNNFATLLTGRVLLGISFALTLSPPLVYLGEVASPSIRGTLLLCPQLVSSVGLLVMYGTGSVLHWRYASLISGLTPAIIMFVTSFLFPRSARWLLLSGRNEEEAKKSIKFFRGKYFDVNEELDAIKESFGNDRTEEANKTEVWANLLNWGYLHPLLLVLIQFLLNVFAGAVALFAFASEIFTKAGAGSDQYINSMYVALTRLPASALSGYLVDRVGRVKLLVISGILCTVSMIVVGAYFWSPILQQYPYIALIFLLTFNFSYSFGSGPLTWVIAGEMLPTPIRSVASNIALTVFALCEFVLVQFYRSTNELFGTHTTFWIYGGINFLQVLFAYFVLPETRGKTLEQIQTGFAKVRQVGTVAVTVNVKERKTGIGNTTGTENKTGIGNTTGTENKTGIENRAYNDDSLITTKL